MTHVLISIVVLSASVCLAAPPKVVKAVPDNGQDEVSPATTEIRVEFDQPMDTGGRSIVGGGDTFPKLTGKPRWVNARTIVIPVKLEPEHEYWLSINNDTFKNFANKQGESAEPYPIQFFTAKAGASGKTATTEPAGDNREAIDRLRKAIDEDYAYRDRLKVGWEKLFASHSEALLSASSTNEFARRVAALLRPAEDAHVWVKAGDTTISTHANPKPPNFNMATLKRVVPGWKELKPTVATGELPDGVGYVMIQQWTDAEATAVETAMKTFQDCKALVIDVRPNGGGDEIAARKIAGLFVTGPKIYSKNRTRRGGQWEGPYDRVIEPRKEGPRFEKSVAVLIGPKVASSCESFVLMMKQSTNCILVGQATKGSSGNPRPHDLGNGVTVFLSSWEDHLPDGTILEGAGVQPDVAVPSKLADFENGDPVLNTATLELRKLPRRT